ncbi:MAG: YggS family pyridoxal phosphate-dependent enzyme [Coxiellaceae bacterium]|nr:YggS family pyridoxal phosphate-dependent enzyme [Coxiellaceae bacterium]
MDVAKNILAIKSQIQEIEKQYKRMPNGVRLLAVSKTQSQELIREAYQAGQTIFGENYLQEAVEKQVALADLDIEWHFIGAIQSNKTKIIAEQFDWVHSIDRFKIAKRLSEQRPTSLPPLNICIEVNIDNEATKSGVLPAALLALVEEISALPNLKLRGLMAIPAHHDQFSEQKRCFDQVAALQQQLVQAGFELDTLSMGMSQDFEAAIAAGSTMVRLGTAIFGARRA